MGYSFYEIYTTSQRAFRGMGFPFGADEDAAYIVAWLELNKLKGVDIFKSNIERVDQQYDGVLNLKETDKKIDFKSKSIFMKGPGLIDFLESIIYQDKKIYINIINCSSSILFLPLLYKAHKNIQYLELTYKDLNNQTNNFKIYDNKIYYSIKEKNINKNEVEITLSNKDKIEINNFYKEIINEKTIQENLSVSLTPNENNWGEISVIANRTFVPESEESRNKGAGGGNAND